MPDGAGDSSIFEGDTHAIAYYSPGTGWSTSYGGIPTMERGPLTYTTISGAISITGYTGFGGAVTIPGYINGLPVTSIGYNAFYNSTITSVTIGANVTSVGQQAFFKCYSLMNATIPNSVTSIGQGAFAACSSLTSVTIPNNVTNIGGNAFQVCTNLTSVTIGSSVTNIGVDAFWGDSTLTNITFLGNAPSLGDGTVFSGHPAGATIYYYYGTSGWGSNYGGLPTVGLGAPFTYTTNGSAITITGYYTNASLSVIIPNYINGLPVTGIAYRAFYGSRLTSVTIPDSVTSIGQYAFAHSCRINLTSVTIPDSVPGIADGAFANCATP